MDFRLDALCVLLRCGLVLFLTGVGFSLILRLCPGLMLLGGLLKLFNLVGLPLCGLLLGLLQLTNLGVLGLLKCGVFGMSMMSVLSWADALRIDAALDVGDVSEACSVYFCLCQVGGSGACSLQVYFYEYVCGTEEGYL